MEEFLKTEGIPYTVTGKGSFLEEENVQRALKFFRALYGNGTETHQKKGAGIRRFWRHTGH